MLYNRDKKRVRVETDCFTCPQFDRRFKRCNGINKVCFEYDPKTRTIIDGKTKLPLKGE